MKAKPTGAKHRNLYAWRGSIWYDRDEPGRIVAVRPRPRQFRTLVNGALGLVEALEEESEQ